VDAVPDAELASLEQEAHRIGLDVLIECHNHSQLERALRLKTPLVGVNNRDLRTFETRLETTLSLREHIPSGRLMVTESGIATPEDVNRLKNAGVSAYLVGSAFMSAEDPGRELSRLFSAS
jgi:indole-3-glycerol phosphate synthase